MFNLLLSIAYLPPIEYFAFLVANNVTIDACERYQKQSYRNRATIINGNGIQNLIIPTVHDFHMGKVTDVRIDYTTPWQRTHWRTIESAYNSTPFFLYYKDAIMPFYYEKTDLLFDFNLNLTKTLVKLLKLNTTFYFTTDFEPYTTNDLRTIIHPKTKRSENYPLSINNLYYQIFDNKFGFLPNLSIIDLLFNIGPEATGYLSNLYQKFQNDNL